MRLDRLGENLLTLHYGDGKVGWLEMFSTLPVGELIESRADYIARCQKDDPDVWYDGLLQERNTRTGALLNPDNYDEIKGWRIYEVTCDDPGLSKPAFLAAKNAERPVESQVRALDRYLTKFVWGGLQRTDAEEWPYGVYGVPDWKNLRDQRNLNGNEQLHIGRLWDFPHVALAWFMMYRIAVRNPQWVSLPATEYLKRAWGTFVAMYRYPDEVGYDYESKLDNTTPYKTGYYNELVIADVIDALRAEGETTKAAQLDAYWNHKADFLIRQAKDLFGSEYAFDTTGFETTQAVVDWGRGHAMRVWNTDGRSVTSYRAGDVERFDRYQRACNVACRGWLENGFYITGSDIRNDTMQYTLSYMSQMGGWSLLEDALYADGSPFKLLRLAYASLLSSWIRAAALCDDMARPAGRPRILDLRVRDRSGLLRLPARRLAGRGRRSRFRPRGLRRRRNRASGREGRGRSRGGHARHAHRADRRREPPAAPAALGHRPRACTARRRAVRRGDARGVRPRPHRDHAGDRRCDRRPVHAARLHARRHAHDHRPEHRRRPHRAAARRQGHDHALTGDTQNSTTGSPR